MAQGEIGNRNRLLGNQHYTNYTIMTFPNWRALNDFAVESLKKKPNTVVNNANEIYKRIVNTDLQEPNNRIYGEFGKQPKSYDDAMSREEFVYWDEYKRIKQDAEKKIRTLLDAESTAEVMQPKLVFNDRELGEFVYDRAAMSLVPNLYYFSPSKKREIDSFKEKIINVKEKDGKTQMKLESDNSLVVYAFKIQKEDGTPIEYVPLKEGEDSLKEANKIAVDTGGILSVSSKNKKVYLYKEKKPKVYNAVKIIVGLTNGGFTTWINDFYTGIAAAIAIEILESLGYSVHVEVALGGGRCSGCYTSLNMALNMPTHYGRRFFTFTAKSFDEPLDLEGLLYTLADPSFHTIKFVSLLNNFFSFFGDGINDRYKPSSTWHGIESEDMQYPIGFYHKYLDIKNKNENLMHFYLHRIENEQQVIEQIKDLVLTCENTNLKLLKKVSNYDFSDNE
jgi:hypothetical protein